MNTYYDYEELVEKALAFDATQEDINALGEWFDSHGWDYWNGEYFEIDRYHSLYPVYKEVAEDNFEIVGYEIR